MSHRRRGLFFTLPLNLSTTGILAQIPRRVGHNTCNPVFTFRIGECIIISVPEIFIESEYQQLSNKKMENEVRKLTQAACRDDPSRMLMNAKIQKIDHHDRHVAATGETAKISISSRLKADLKNKGILAFKQLTDDEQKRVWQWCNEVVRLYRDVLETDPRNIRNVESLPFPKEDIRLALKMSLPLYISKGMHSMVRKLKNAYQETGTFQTIDPKDHAILSTATTPGKKEISKKQYSDVDRANNKYMERVISEKKGLLQDINNFVQELEALTS